MHIRKLNFWRVWYAEELHSRRMASLHPKQWTHCGRVTHMFVSNLTIIGSDNGLSPAGILWIGPIGTNFSDNSIKNSYIFIQQNIFEYVIWTKWWPFCLGLNVLTLNVRGPSYLGLTRSISWLLKRWLLTSLGHQQPWYWLCRIGRFLSYLRRDFNYLCRTNVEKWHKM